MAEEEGHMVIRSTVIKFEDMPEEKKAIALDLATKALTRFYSEDEMAHFIVEEMTKRYNPFWHCFIGRKFGCSVNYEEGNYIFFYVGSIGFLIFKSGEE